MDMESVSVEFQGDREKVSARKRNRRKTSAQHNLWVTLLFVVLWGALVYGGYWYLDLRLDQMQQHLTRSIAAVQETNNRQITELDEKLHRVQEEIQDISLALEQTGKEISTSGTSAREELNKRIKELDSRLAELAHSLEILKESKGEIR